MVRELFPYLGTDIPGLSRRGISPDYFPKEPLRRSRDISAYFTLPEVSGLVRIYYQIMNQNIATFLNELAGDNPEQLEKPSILAKFLGIKPDTLHDWVSRYPNHLPALKLPSSIRIRRCDLVDFLKKINSGEIK